MNTNTLIDDIIADYESRDYSSYPPKDAEALKSLDKYVESVAIEAVIMTETEKIWRNNSQR